MKKLKERIKKVRPSIKEILVCDICFEEITTCEHCCDELVINEPIYCSGMLEHYCENCAEELKGKEKEE